MKYDFDLSLDEHTSVGKIIEQIEDNSRVLEFGPGNGRMTRYLMQEKKCEVSIVEFDPELFEFVMTFATDGVMGNIEDYKWCEHFAGKTFDYIVFADVLEHLTDSEKALGRAREFLADQGRILITFPNLAHNSVLIDLFNNRLDWKTYGLLDRTHNSFYTQQGFEELFARQNLYVAKEDYTYSQVGQNELQASYSDLPTETQYAFRNRLFGEVYQYFYALSKEVISDPVRLVPENSNFVHQAQLVFDYETEQEVQPLLFNNYTGENKRAVLPLKGPVSRLRILPIIETAIWEVQAFLDGQAIKLHSNADTQIGNYYIFDDEKKDHAFEAFDLEGEQLTLVFDVLSEKSFDRAEHLILDELRKKKTELNKAHQRLEILETFKGQIAYRPYNGEEDTLFSLSIDEVDYDDLTNQTFVKGWGFEKETQQPVQIFQDPSVKKPMVIRRVVRTDVNDMFQLMQQEAYGFTLTIDGDIDESVQLIFQATGGSYHAYSFPNPSFKADKDLSTGKFRKGLNYLRQNGLNQTIQRLMSKQVMSNGYDTWINENESYDLAIQAEESRHFAYRPLISLVVPVYNVEERWLRRCVHSLTQQSYSNWELCLADDASTEEYIRPLLEELMAEDERIKVVFREKNGHISEATNSAIGLATGEYIGFMDNDDELAPNALYEVVKALNKDQTIDFIYTDEDKITTSGKRFDPFFKPDWNAELLLGHNYITHFVVIKNELLKVLTGGLRNEYNGSQDYDFVLRATENATNIYHIRKILYHWRTVETSVAFDPESKSYAYVAGQKAVQAALDRRGVAGTVSMTENYGAYKIDYDFELTKKVVVIPTDPSNVTREWVEKILVQPTGASAEMFLPKQLEQTIGNYFGVVYTDEPAEQTIQQTNAHYLLFLSPKISPKNPAWLTELLNYSQKETTGIVTGKIINKKNQIVEVGITIDPEKRQIHFPQQEVSNDTIGYYFRTVLPREIQAVSADYLMIKKEDYLAVGGFAKAVPPVIQGVDLSLKVRNKLHKKVVFEPYSVMEAADDFVVDGTKGYSWLEENYTQEELNDADQLPRFIN